VRLGSLSGEGIVDIVLPEANAAAPVRRLHDRRRPAVRIRRVRADDDTMVADFIRNLSPSSRLRRFHAGIRELMPEWLQRMTHPDLTRELALVAVVREGEREICVAEARYVLSDDVGVGREFALVVADAWQGRGLGKTLLLHLGCHAARHGVERLVGDVLRDNLAMIDLVRGVGYDVRSHPADPRLLRVERSFGATVPALRPPMALAGQASFETQRGLP
jgi:acetyltransferase